MGSVFEDVLLLKSCQVFEVTLSELFLFLMFAS